MKTMSAMTRIFFIPVLLAGTLSALDCFAQDPGADIKAALSPTTEISSTLESRKQRLSYAFGMALGRQFRMQAVEVDPELYILGFRDGLSGGKMLMTEKEALTAINNLRGEMKNKQAIAEASVELSGIAVSFKLDPRLTRGMYMGDRWVSPPIYTNTVMDGKEHIVEARAEGIDAKGGTRKISPEWITDDPEMVTVVPAQGEEVKITVRRAGHSILMVTSAGISKRLTIRGTYQDNALKVEISQ